MAEKPTFREAWRFWLKLGLISFGGPTGQIAILHTELVERRKWIGEARFLRGGKLDAFALGGAVAAFVAMQRFKAGVIAVVVGGGAVGWMASVVGLS